MSWSDERAGKQRVKASVVRERIRQVDAVLSKLRGDEDFQDRMRLSVVQKALRHWTNQQRLPPDEAMMLQESRDVVYVLQRFQMIQAVCREATIAIPMDLIQNQATALPEHMVNKLLADAQPELDTAKPQVAGGDASKAKATVVKPAKADASKTPQSQAAQAATSTPAATADVPKSDAAPSTRLAQPQVQVEVPQSRTTVLLALLAVLVAVALAMRFANAPPEL